MVTKQPFSLLIFLILLILAGCAPAPPTYKLNICKIFRKYPKWYWATQSSQKRWRVPISVQMALVYQESRFNAYAKPPRTRLLWIIPWSRPTSAVGYSQATNGTWRRYQLSTGRTGADREEFADAVDFIGWYGYRAHRRAGISRLNAYAIYLAYHEGIGGYERRTYRHKPWLIKVARKVQRIANRYQAQLNRCEKYLKRKPWWRRLFGL